MAAAESLVDEPLKAHGQFLDQPFLFTVPRDEHERMIEAVLAHHPRRLHDAGRARGVVVGTGIVIRIVMATNDDKLAGRGRAGQDADDVVCTAIRAARSESERVQ